MKNFDELKLELIWLNSSDVITTSGIATSDGVYDYDEEDGFGWNTNGFFGN